MARRNRGDEGGGEWPTTEEEHTDAEQEQPVKPEIKPVPSDRPKKLTVMTPEGMQEISTDPTDLEDYEGEYKQLATGETFGLKVVNDDPQGRTHHLKNVDHYWAGTAAEFRQAFEKQ